MSEVGHVFSRHYWRYWRELLTCCHVWFLSGYVTFSQGKIVYMKLLLYTSTSDHNWNKWLFYHLAQDARTITWDRCFGSDYSLDFLCWLWYIYATNCRTLKCIFERLGCPPNHKPWCISSRAKSFSNIFRSEVYKHVTECENTFNL